MIWRSHICFSVWALAAVASAATVTGRVELRDSREAAVRKSQDYSGVVVWLEPSSTTPMLSATKAQIVQKDKRFTPHILAVAAGTRVDFPNFDPIFHNAFSNFDGQVFDVGLYPPGTSRSVRFERPGVVRIFCNIHATMSALIAVLGSPYFSTSRRDGSFEIREVPPGEYQLRIFHERALPALTRALERKLSVTADLALPVLNISENGYLSIPHRNKFGKDYSNREENPLYPGARK